MEAAAKVVRHWRSLRMKLEVVRNLEGVANLEMVQLKRLLRSIRELESVADKRL
jgi:hypothetical protein